MPGTRQTNTFSEGLQKLLVEIGYLKTTPDADLQFIYELETTVLTKIREPQEQLAAIQAGQAGQAGMPPLDMMMAGGAGLPPAGPPVGGGVPGLRQVPPTPSGDELSRLLA
jgi:hypothetical protein